MNNEKAAQQEDGVLVKASSPAWMLLFLPLLWEWWEFPQSPGETSWKEARVSPLEGIPGSGTETGASCTVEEFVHAKKILLASVQTEWCDRDEKKDAWLNSVCCTRRCLSGCYRPSGSLLDVSSSCPLRHCPSWRCLASPLP